MRLKKIFYEMVRYGVVGVSSTAVDFGSYWLLTRPFGQNPFGSNIAAYLVGHTISFLGNRHWTFKSTGHPVGEYRRFWIVNLVGLGISQGVFILSFRAGMPDMIGKVLSVVFSGAWNFTLNRFWTFRKHQITVV